MRLFTILALALAIGLGTALSPFASSSPDGLQKVAERKAFLDESRTQDKAVALRLRDPGCAGRAAGPRPGRVRRHARRVPRGLRHRGGRAAPAGGGMSVHSLHGVGIAGDPASPVHRLDPAGQAPRAGERHAGRRLDPAARVAGVRGLRDACWRGSRSPGASGRACCGRALAWCCRWCSSSGCSSRSCAAARRCRWGRSRCPRRAWRPSRPSR